MRSTRPYRSQDDAPEAAECDDVSKPDRYNVCCNIRDAAGKLLLHTRDPDYPSPAYTRCERTVVFRKMAAPAGLAQPQIPKRLVNPWARRQQPNL